MSNQGTISNQAVGPRRKRKRDRKSRRNESSKSRESEAEHKRNLINAIGLERKNNELTKIRLVQLHEHYGKLLDTLRSETNSLKRTMKILKSDLSQRDLAAVYVQNEGLKNQHEQQRAMRIKDEQHLKQTNQENQKLVIIVHYLKQQLQTLMTQYQLLCNKKVCASAPVHTSHILCVDAAFNHRERREIIASVAVQSR